MTCVESSKRSYFLHLLVITLRTKTRQFISPVQRAIRNALVSPETSYGSSEAALGDFVPASLEGAYARQMLVEDSSGYCGIAPVWRWPSCTAAENITEGSGGACIKPNQRCCQSMLAARQSYWKALPLFCDTNRQSMELAGVASVAPRKFIAWMADHPSGPRIFQAASRPTSAEPSPPCPQPGPGERGQTWAKTWDTEGFGALLMHHAADLPLLAPHCASPVSRHVQVLYGSSAARG